MQFIHTMRGADICIYYHDLVFLFEMLKWLLTSRGERERRKISSTLAHCRCIEVVSWIRKDSRATYNIQQTKQLLLSLQFCKKIIIFIKWPELNVSNFFFGSNPRDLAERYNSFELMESFPRTNLALHACAFIVF